MKRLSALLLVSLAVVVAVGERGKAQSDPRPLWEYAVLRVMTVDQEMIFQWYANGEHVESRSFEEFQGKLHHSRRESSGSKVIDVLNGLGSDGWELTTSDIARTEHTETERFFLKRRIN